MPRAGINPPKFIPNICFSLQYDTKYLLENFLRYNNYTMPRAGIKPPKFVSHFDILFKNIKAARKRTIKL